MIKNYDLQIGIGLKGSSAVVTTLNTIINKATAAGHAINSFGHEGVANTQKFESALGKLSGSFKQVLATSHIVNEADQAHIMAYEAGLQRIAQQKALIASQHLQVSVPGFNTAMGTSVGSTPKPPQFLETKPNLSFYDDLETRMYAHNKVIESSKQGVKVLGDEYTEVFGKKSRMARGAMIGIGMSALFMGMALKQFFSGLLRGMMNVYREAIGNNSELIQATNRLNAAWTFFKFSMMDALDNDAVVGFIDRVVSIVDWFGQLSDTSKRAFTGIIIGFIVGGTAAMIFGQMFLLASALVMAGTATMGTALLMILGVLSVIIIAFALIGIIVFSDGPKMAKIFGVLATAVIAVIVVLLIMGVIVMSIPIAIALIIAGIVLVLSLVIIFRHKLHSFFTGDAPLWKKILLGVLLGPIGMAIVYWDELELAVKKIFNNIIGFISSAMDNVKLKFAKIVKWFWVGYNAIPTTKKHDLTDIEKDIHDLTMSIGKQTAATELANKALDDQFEATKKARKEQEKLTEATSKAGDSTSGFSFDNLNPFNGEGSMFDDIMPGLGGDTPYDFSNIAAGNNDSSTTTNIDNVNVQMPPGYDIDSTFVDQLNEQINNSQNRGI